MKLSLWKTRFDAEDRFEVKVKIIRQMTGLDPTGDWMKKGARAIDDPRTATGEPLLEKRTCVSVKNIELRPNDLDLVKSLLTLKQEKGALKLEEDTFVEVDLPEMACKRIVKWPIQGTTSLVEQFIRSKKDTNKALTVFDSAAAEYGNGFRHDHNTFGVIISRLLSANEFRSAEDMLDRMKKGVRLLKTYCYLFAETILLI